MSDIEKAAGQVKEASSFVIPLIAAMEEVVVGKREILEHLVMALLTGGHVLIQGVPGLAKTLIIKTLAGAVKTGFQRIQFTPDLLPSDILGTMVYNPKEGSFTIKKGPIFTNIILADEINRAPAKVQSALLQAMQEKLVTIGDQTFSLEDPFLVLATQNPIEQEGTYPLPEAQIDRFMFKLDIGYPTKEEELKIVDRMSFVDKKTQVKPAAAPEQILKARQVLNEVYADDKIKDYIVNIVIATREPERFKLDLKPYISYGASVRASINITLAAKAHAFIHGRAYVTPLDVKAVCPQTLCHRIILSYEAEAEDITQRQLVKTILDTVPVP